MVGMRKVADGVVISNSDEYQLAGLDAEDIRTCSVGERKDSGVYRA